MSNLRSLCVAVALGALSTGAALAQPVEEGLGADRPVKFVLGFGLTTGGDKLATADAYGGETENVRAGSGVDIKGGVEWRFVPGLSLQATLGHHEDRVSDWGTSVGFRRSTVELLGHAHVAPQFRLGAGLRKTYDASFVNKNDDVKVNSDYSARLAPVLEGEYFFNRMVSLKARYVAEQFKNKTTGTKVDGDHGGIYLGLYF